MADKDIHLRTANRDHHPKHVTPIIRFYIDIRPMVRWGDLPLLNTLTTDQQESVNRFVRPADKLMALASALLKNIFVHRYAQIPWKRVEIQRTPPPHRRPHWVPPIHWSGEGGLEFNVTHQAGITALVGCQTPKIPEPLSPHYNGADMPEENSKPMDCIRLGCDVACTNEDKRTPQDITSQEKLDEWVDVFSEMFGDSERKEMKQNPLINKQPGKSIYLQKLRRFYAFWALKEAYIKLCGEGLLASWLRELEFSKVIAPWPTMSCQKVHHQSNEGHGFSLPGEELNKWSAPKDVERDTVIHLNGIKVDDVQTEISAYEQDFLFVVAMRGLDEPPERKKRAHWIKLDIEKDIRPCAEGRCSCLDQTVVSRAVPVASPMPLGGDENPFYNIIGAQVRA